ncbi:hypothetical protein [Aquirufa rosea]|uniref:Uncharacterized protein n=1 Tax=Aquirufa rosea TaxID=2509241 RepID=A0A4Q1BYY8_9BACT|nr:hypothetical protein [Aquirufa rosea]RXK48737.1 hypothetical protein ESB04_07190 [Aquirufa rosea]
MKINRNWIYSLASLLAFSYLMQWQGAALKNPWTPMGIVHLEFAPSREIFQSIIKKWDLNTLKWNIILDFLYIPIYTYFFQYTLRLLAKMHRSRLVQNLGLLLIQVMIFAFICDVFENIGMLTSLYLHSATWIYTLTSWMAGIKFLILSTCLIYIIVSIPAAFLSAKQEP